jgi:hypothetical protein
MNRFDELNARVRKFRAAIPPRSFFRRPDRRLRSAQITRARTALNVGNLHNINSATTGPIKKALDADRAEAAPAVVAVAGGHFGDVNCFAAQAGGKEAGLYKKDDQP